MSGYLAVAVVGAGMSYYGNRKARKAALAAAERRAAAARRQADEIRRRFEANKIVFNQDVENAKGKNTRIALASGIDMSGGVLQQLDYMQQEADKQMDIEQSEADYTINALMTQADDIMSNANSADRAAKFKNFGNLALNLASAGAAYGSGTAAKIAVTGNTLIQSNEAMTNSAMTESQQGDFEGASYSTSNPVYGVKSGGADPATGEQRPKKQAFNKEFYNY